MMTTDTPTLIEPAAAAAEATSELVATNGSGTPEKRKRQGRRRYQNKRVADAGAPNEIIPAKPESGVVVKPNQQPSSPKRRRGRGAFYYRGPFNADSTRPPFNHEVNKQSSINKQTDRPREKQPDGKQTGEEQPLTDAAPTAVKTAGKKRPFYRPRRRGKRAAAEGKANDADGAINESLTASGKTEGSTGVTGNSSDPTTMAELTVKPKRQISAQRGTRGEVPYDRRLFGRFECKKCEHNWSSVSAWRGKKQACKLCSTMCEAVSLNFLFHRKRRVEPDEIAKEEDTSATESDKDNNVAVLPDDKKETVPVVVGDTVEPGLEQEGKRTQQHRRLPHPQHLCEMCLHLGYCCREKAAPPADANEASESNVEGDRTTDGEEKTECNEIENNTSVSTPAVEC